MSYKNMTALEERVEAKRLLDILLQGKFNTDEEGSIANDLLHLLDCKSIDLLEEFFEKSNCKGHYGALSFIVDEGYFKDCLELMPLLKTIHNKVDDGYTHYFILPKYIELCRTKEELKYVVERLIGKYKDRLIPNLYWGITGMTDKQFKILASFDTEKKYPLYLFDRSIVKDIDFFKKEILNKDKIYQEIIFLSAVIRKFSKKELLKLSKLSQNNNLLDWYN